MTTLPAGALWGMMNPEVVALAEALALVLATVNAPDGMVMGAGMRRDVTVTPAMDSFHDMRPLPVRPLPPIPQRFGLPCVFQHLFLPALISLKSPRLKAALQIALEVQEAFVCSA